MRRRFVYPSATQSSFVDCWTQKSAGLPKFSRSWLLYGIPFVPNRFRSVPS